MEFQDMETAVVDVLRTPEIQRLRRIRHLGLAHLVFPGAEHSRFVHSIGAAHLAIRFTKRLIESSANFLTDELSPGPSVVRDVALAALCHDLGHGPLSHVWEKEAIGHDFDRRAMCHGLGISYETAFDSLKWHEIVGQALLNWPEGHLHRLLEQQEEDTSARLRRLLVGDYYLTYLPRMLSSDVDVDRSDYILRDAHETGVRYGRYDLDWLVSSLVIGEAEGKRLVVGFDLRKAPRVVEQFLIARRALYDTVYYHKTVRSAEGMIGLLLRRLKHVVRDLGHKDLLQPKLFNPYRKVVLGEMIEPRDILGLDDYSLWVLIQFLSETDVDVTLADLARRIVERDLFKVVPCKESQLSAFLERADAKERLCAVVGGFCLGDPDFYFHVDKVSIKMLEDNTEQCAYFVDAEHDGRPASRITDHAEFRMHWKEPSPLIRLFVPREAVDDVRKLVEFGKAK
jgi:HD superfamily phosphohydrolase